MTIQKRRRREKIRLWKIDPHCKNCGRLTFIPMTAEDGSKEDCATIQHLFDKLSPFRGSHLDNVELWCAKCNHEDNIQMLKLYGEQK